MIFYNVVQPSVGMTVESTRRACSFKSSDDKYQECVVLL